MDLGGGVGETAVADGARCLRHQVDDVLRAVHVARPQLVVALLAQHRLAKVDVGARVVLPADEDDLVARASRHLDPEVGPALDIAPLAVDLGELLDRDLLDRIVVVEEDREGIVAHHELAGVGPGRLGRLQLLGLDLAARIGDVDSAVDQGRHAGAGAAAGDGDGDVGRHRLVGFGPSLGDVDQRVGAFVLDDGARSRTALTAAAAGDGDDREGGDTGEGETRSSHATTSLLVFRSDERRAEVRSSAARSILYGSRTTGRRQRTAGIGSRRRSLTGYGGYRGREATGKAMVVWITLLASRGDGGGPVAAAPAAAIGTAARALGRAGGAGRGGRHHPLLCHSETLAARRAGERGARRASRRSAAPLRERDRGTGQRSGCQDWKLGSAARPHPAGPRHRQLRRARRRTGVAASRFDHRARRRVLARGPRIDQRDLRRRGETRDGGAPAGRRRGVPTRGRGPGVPRDSGSALDLSSRRAAAPADVWLPSVRAVRRRRRDSARRTSRSVRPR